jgi:hypothetical protein
MSGRRRVRLGVVASLACAIMLLAATAASATPGSLEFGKCTATAGGKFKNSGCTKLAKTAEEQKFEWAPLAAGVAVTSLKAAETGLAVLEAANGTEVSCTAQSSSVGEFGPASKEMRNIVLVFTGCKTLGCSAHSKGAKEEEIVFNPLRAVPGIVTLNEKGKEEKDIVGLDFKPQSGTTVAEFECGPAPITVRGGVITTYPANKMLNKVTIGFHEEKSKQQFEEFVGGASEFLEESFGGGAFEHAGLSLSTVLRTSPKTTKVELRHCEMNVC